MIVFSKVGFKKLMVLIGACFNTNTAYMYLLHVYTYFNILTINSRRNHVLYMLYMQFKLHLL